MSETVRRIGLGVAAFHNEADWQQGQAVATLRTAWDCGLRLFDTSALYGGGVTEEGLGRFLHEEGDGTGRATTKCGRFRDHGAPAPRDGGTTDWRDYGRAATRRSVERSLARLGEGCIETVFIHDPDDHMAEALDGAYRVLRDMAGQGLIGGVGVATNNARTAAAMLERAPFDAVMLANTHSVLDPAAAAQVLAAAREFGTRVFVAGVFLSGILASGTAGKARYRYRAPHKALRERVARLEALAARHGTNLRALALGFVARDAAVDVITLGASRPEQLSQSLDDLAHPLPDALWNALEECEEREQTRFSIAGRSLLRTNTT